MRWTSSVILKTFVTTHVDWAAAVSSAMPLVMYHPGRAESLT